MENKTIIVRFDRVPEDLYNYIGEYVGVETKEHNLYSGTLSTIYGSGASFAIATASNEHMILEKDDIVEFMLYPPSETIPTKSEPTKMSVIRFRELLDELDGNSLETLKEKNGRYAKNGDALHNFRKGAIMNRETLAQTCWGYMSKHLVALQDMVEFDDFSNREDFLEKCQDTINYIRFLWCIGNEETLVKTETLIEEGER